MATLVRKRKRSSFIGHLLRHSGDVLVLADIPVAMFFVVAVGGLVASATGVVGYLVFSGWVTQAIATVMANVCLSAGNCSDFPALLSGLAVGVMILAVIAIAIVGPWVSRPDDEYPERSADMSQATLLLNWYCLSGQSRDVLLKLLETSDAEPSEPVLRLLRAEHKAIEEVMNGGG